MSLIEIKHNGNRDATAAAPDESAVAELREAIRGELLTPGDDGYAEAAQVWNGAHVGRPAVIVRCRGAADVLEAVSFARIHGLQIAVRGGGHSIAGFSTNVGGIVIDLSAMNDVRVDTATRCATVGGGAVWADVDTRRRPTAWPRPAGWCRARGSRGSRSAEASAG